LVKLQNGILVRRHQDQLRKCVKTNVTVTNKSDEKLLSAPNAVIDSTPSDISRHQQPHREHHLPVRYRDSGNCFLCNAYIFLLCNVLVVIVFFRGEEM